MACPTDGTGLNHPRCARTRHRRYVLPPWLSLRPQELLLPTCELARARGSTSLTCTRTARRVLEQTAALPHRATPNRRAEPRGHSRPPRSRLAAVSQSPLASAWLPPAARRPSSVSIDPPHIDELSWGFGRLSSRELFVTVASLLTTRPQTPSPPSENGPCNAQAAPLRAECRDPITGRASIQRGLRLGFRGGDAARYSSRSPTAHSRDRRGLGGAAVNCAADSVRRAQARAS